MPSQPTALYRQEPLELELIINLHVLLFNHTKRDCAYTFATLAKQLLSKHRPCECQPASHIAIQAKPIASQLATNDGGLQDYLTRIEHYYMQLPSHNYKSSFIIAIQYKYSTIYGSLKIATFIYSVVKHNNQNNLERSKTEYNTELC